MPELISLIVTTYNREDALGAVLRSLARQTDRNFEIIVADDGSGPATGALIAAFMPRLDVPLYHVWQEDRGFRAAEIRNRAIVRSRGTLCIFLDGDCIARPNFVAAHRALAEAGWFVAGNRVLLGRAITERILKEQLEPELWPVSRWIKARARGEINRLLPILPLPVGVLRKSQSQTFTLARSANLAIWRDDLLAVDGFDAAYQGWGREDSDIGLRLIRSGARCKVGRFAAGVLHLWHPFNDRNGLAQNDRRLKSTIGSDRVRALQGLSALRIEALSTTQPSEASLGAGPVSGAH